MSRFLFTLQISDDLGLLARSLPITQELVRRGHEVAFCNPAPAPSKLIAEAGFANLPVKHPLYLLNELRAGGRRGLRGLHRAARAGAPAPGLWWNRPLPAPAALPRACPAACAHDRGLQPGPLPGYARRRDRALRPCRERGAAEAAERIAEVSHAPGW